MVNDQMSVTIDGVYGVSGKLTIKNRGKVIHEKECIGMGEAAMEATIFLENWDPWSEDGPIEEKGTE